MANGYLEYRKDGRNAYYKLGHPNKLYGLIEQKKRENALAEHEMEEGIRSIIGAYNLSQNKPGVRFFEGKDGFKEALYDTLSAKEGIYAYLDYDSLTNLAEINNAYVIDRRKAGVMKKILVPNTPENIKAAIPGAGDLTEIRILPTGITAFPTTLQIYNDKIAYLTLKKEQIISVIIENDAIAKMQKTMFEYQWSISSPLANLVQTQNNEKPSPAGL